MELTHSLSLTITPQTMELGTPPRQVAYVVVTGTCGCGMMQVTESGSRMPSWYADHIIWTWTTHVAESDEKAKDVPDGR